MSIHQIADKLGRAKIAACVGVKPGAVTEALRAGVFPSAWFVALTTLGRSNGVNIPQDVFRWKSAITDTNTTRGETQRESGVKGK